MHIKLIDNMRDEACNECGSHPEFVVEVGGDFFERERLLLCDRHARKLARQLFRFIQDGKSVPNKQQRARVLRVPKRIERQARANERAAL